MCARILTRSYPIFMVSGNVVVAKVRMMSPVSSRLLSFFLSILSTSVTFCALSSLRMSSLLMYRRSLE